MTRETLQWAAFVAVLVPLIVRNPGEPVWLTAAHIAFCFVLVAVAGRIERDR